LPFFKHFLYPNQPHYLGYELELT